MTNKYKTATNYVYSIVTRDGLCSAYIGVTANPKARIKAHASSNTDIGRWIRKSYGRQLPRVEILFSGSRDKALAFEKRAVITHRTAGNKLMQCESTGKSLRSIRYKMPDAAMRIPFEDACEKAAKDGMDPEKLFANAEISEELNDALNKACVVMRRPRAFIIREALTYYMATQKGVL